jgi:Fe-S-cluster containining protein
LGLAAGVKSFRHDPEQRFTCGRCTRCCRHWDVVVTAAEAESLRRPALARLWSEHAELEEHGAGLDAGAGAPSPSAPDPLEPAPHGLLTIRRRADGTCGFLATDGACRIHAEHGASKKPLACRLFPFRLYPSEGVAVVTAAFSCPTVAANTGAPLAAQLGEISSAAKEWQRAFPPAPPSLRFTAKRVLTGAAAG